MGERVPGVIGTVPPVGGNPIGGMDWPPGGGSVEPGPGGIDPPSPMTDRIIAKVDDDWHPPAPDTSAAVTVEGTTLADVGDALKSMDEWGRGGGALRADPIAV